MIDGIKAVLSHYRYGMPVPGNILVEETKQKKTIHNSTYLKKGEKIG